MIADDVGSRLQFEVKVFFCSLPQRVIPRVLYQVLVLEIASAEVVNCLRGKQALEWDGGGLHLKVFHWPLLTI